MTERTRKAQKIGRVAGRGATATALRAFAMVDSSVGLTFRAWVQLSNCLASVDNAWNILELGFDTPER
jgi:hypothetical protein